jgi:hypothetical protein
VATRELKRDEKRDGKPFVVKVESGKRHVLLLRRRHVFFVEFSEALFRTNSAVPLPGHHGASPGAEEDSTRPEHSVFTAAATALRYAQTHTEQPCVVAGHTDSVGSNEANVRLSQLRADAVHGLLVGQRDEFASACFGPHLTNEQRYPNGGDGSKAGVLWQDYADTLNWVADEFGWPCRTGYPDSAPWIYDATVAFQRTYNSSDIGQAKTSPLTVNGHFDQATWGAVYDCYELGLAGALRGDMAELAQLRSLVKAPQGLPPKVACGEMRPVDPRSKDDFDSASNRRAEIQFFDAKRLPVLPCSSGPCTPEECELCGTLFFRRKRIGQDEILGSIPVMTLFLLDHRGQRMGADPESADPIAQAKGAPYVIVLPSGEKRTGYADVEGKVVEYEFPRNVSCLVSWGKHPDSLWYAIPDSPADYEDFFEYKETVFIGERPPAGDTSDQYLSNLGYAGAPDERRGGFATDYGDGEPATIHLVHATGKPRAVV